MSSRKRTPIDTTETAIPGTETPAAEAATAVAEPPAAEAQADGPSFAERVGQKQRPAMPDPFGIASDNLAGVRLMESRLDGQVAISFQDKPSQQVIDKLKLAGFRWNPLHKIWAHPVRSNSALQTRIDAERLYQEIRTTIRQEKGIETDSPGVPF
jgi:hypothetical protein